MESDTTIQVAQRDQKGCEENNTLIKRNPIIIAAARTKQHEGEEDTGTAIGGEGKGIFGKTRQTARKKGETNEKRKPY